MVVVQENSTSVATDERGSPLELGYFTVQGQIFDRGEPTPQDLLYMLNTESQVQSIARAIALPLQRAQLTIEESPGDKGEAAFVRKILFDPPETGGMETPMGAVVQQMISAVFLKRAYFEKVWRKTSDNKAVYQKIAFRPTTTCTTLAENSGLKGFKQQGTKDDGEPFEEDFLVAKRKCFVYFHADETKPLIGTTVLQTAYGDFIDKLRVNRLWNIHLQNYALGTWVGKYSGAVRDAAKALFNKLKRFQGGGGVMVLESNEDADIKGRSGAGAEFEAKLNYLDTQMAGSTMLRWQMLGTNSNTGSWALSRDHSDFFLMLEEAVLDDMAENITYGLIADLVEVNFGKNAAIPRAKFDPLEEQKLDAAREAYMTLSTAANHPTGPLWDALEERFARAVDIPLEIVEKQKEHNKQNPPQPPGAPPAPAPTSNGAGNGTQAKAQGAPKPGALVNHVAGLINGKGSGAGSGAGSGTSNGKDNAS